MARKRVQPVIEDAPRRSREMDREWHDYSTPADPHFAMLCAKSIAMWMAGADPEAIAQWLESKQNGCIVNLRDQLFAVRGLPPYRHSNPLNALLSAATTPSGVNFAPPAAATSTLPEME